MRLFIPVHTHFDLTRIYQAERLLEHTGVRFNCYDHADGGKKFRVWDFSALQGAELEVETDGQGRGEKVSLQEDLGRG